MELLVWIPLPTARHRYVCHLIFEELLGLRLRWCDGAASFAQYPGAKLSYARPTDFAADYVAAPLLWERDVSARARPAADGLPFPVTGGRWPFDPLAAAFFLVSRYEEYLPCQDDAHGRFPEEQNWLVARGWADLPVVNTWAAALYDELAGRFALPARRPAFRFWSTFDVDNAYAFRHKGAVRAAGGTLRDLLRGDAARLRGRLRSWAGGRDPYDTYDRLATLHLTYGVKPLFFWLLADPGPFDKNVAPTRPAMRALIRRVSTAAGVGIHPSYASFAQPTRITDEKRRLEQMLNVPVTAGRQHYLRFRLPHTYRSLLQAGITADHSMGFSGRTGFRAGIAHPFYWYDLTREQPTALRVWPFALMDTALLHAGFTPPQALAHATALVDRVTEVGGWLVTLFHNESPGGLSPWDGWEHVYEQILAYATAPCGNA